MSKLQNGGPSLIRYGDTLVSVFENTMAGGSKSADVAERSRMYDGALNTSNEMSLRDFLRLGVRYLAVLNEIRSCNDEKRIRFLKKYKLPAASISVFLTTRDKSVSPEDKIRQYNSLMVLDFDHLDDVEAAKEKLSRFPCFWYIGLSCSGKGLFGIVPVATSDWKQHKAYYLALKKEMAAMGFKTDDACKDYGRLRFVSYDEHPWVNEDCEVFVLEDVDDDPDDEGRDAPDGDMKPQREDNDNTVLKYVEQWERMKVPLDEYSDWIAMGMSLTSLGDSGPDCFQRISRFSSKYDERQTEKVFLNLQQNTRRVGLGTFFYKCQQYGVIPDCIPHYEPIPFPVEVFPGKIQEIIQKTGEHNHFPPGYIAPAMLFVACLACGNAAVVEIVNGWREKPLLYLGIVGCRGTNKTGSLEFALDPIRLKEDEEYEAFVEAKQKYEEELMKADKKKKKPLVPPECKQYILDDFTPESIVRTHKANPRALIVFQDELMGFISSFNKYRSGSDEQMWTQLFAGRGVMVNRVSTDPVKINDTCIGIMGGIQPQMLRDFARGKVQNGFMDRWLLSYPDKVPYPKFNDKDISSQIRKNWRQIVNRILDLPYDEQSRIIRLSKEAKRIYKEWYDRLADQKNNGSLAFAGMATKMEPYCGRLALGLEIIKYGCNEGELKEISADSMRGAINLCYYFMACGLKAQKQFLPSPTAEFTTLQQIVYDELPKSFDTSHGLKIAESMGMPERTFKRWLGTSFFKKISHGFYEKRFH